MDSFTIVKLTSFALTFSHHILKHCRSCLMSQEEPRVDKTLKGSIIL